jgi:hypothetical protein
MYIYYDKMIKCLEKNPVVANNEVFILTKNTYEQYKNSTEPCINGNEMYLNYINAVDIITKLYNKFCIK